MMRTIWFLVAVLCVSAGGLIVVAAENVAFMSLLYGDEFLLGVRVLGKSIRNTGSNKDMVVLVSDGVSDYAKNLLKADGWIVKDTELIVNPNQVRPKRLWGIYTKLKIFSMTNYTKVVYLDADTLVVNSIEDLFKCGKFCANLKHSERLNAGVLVVEPSETIFEDMMRQVNSLYSYTGGDQGFIDSYYPDFPNAHIFDPNVRLDVVPEMQRLSTVYNADIGLYMLANKWMVNETELRIIHYTLGPLKPWDWWTSWLLKPVDVWQNIRRQLEDSLPGTGRGKNPHDELLVKILFIFPVCLLIFYYYQSSFQINKDASCLMSQKSLCAYAMRRYLKFRLGGFIHAYSAVGLASIANPSKQFSDGTDYKLPVYLGAISIFICFLAAIFSIALAFVLVPRQVLPWTGLLLMYELSFTSFFTLYKSYLNFIYQWGKLRAAQVVVVANHSCLDPSSYDSRKCHQHGVSDCDLWISMACVAVTAPMSPWLLGVITPFAGLSLMVAGGIIFVIFATFASKHMALRAFTKGHEGQDQLKARRICILRL